MIRHAARWLGLGLLLPVLALAQQQPVNVGTLPNDNTGDPDRTAYIKLNANDAQLYGMWSFSGIVYATGPVPNPPRAATGADVVSLWGTTPQPCSATTFLRGDHNCAYLDLTADVAGVLPFTSGGLGLSTANLGDTWYASATNTLSALPGNTSTTRKFYSQTGTGSAAAAPVWTTLAAGDIAAAGSNGQLQIDNGGLVGGLSSGVAGNPLLSTGPGAAPAWFADLKWVTNSANGNTATILPQSTTALNQRAGPFNFVNYSALFTTGSGQSNLRDDEIFESGYNVPIAGQWSGSLIDTFANGQTFESDYEYAVLLNASATSSSATGGSTTTLTDSTMTWAVNQWGMSSTDLAYILVNVTNSTACFIASNTTTQITCAAAMVNQSDGTTAGAANASGNTYEIFIAQMENYIQFSMQMPDGNASYLRPWSFTWDRASAAEVQAQGATGGVEGLMTITAATNASPAVFTTSVSHGVPRNGDNLYRSYVTFENLAGGTWNTLNGHTYLATWVSDTTFQIANLPGTSLGTYTASSGGIVRNPILHNAAILVPAGDGIHFSLPTWSGSGASDSDVAQLTDNALLLHARPGAMANSNAFILHMTAEANSSTDIIMDYNAFTAWDMPASATGTWQLDTYNGSGGNKTLAAQCKQGDVSTNTCAIGGEGNVLTGILNITNRAGVNGGFPLLYIEAESAQSSDLVQVFNSGGSTKEWWLDKNYIGHNQALESTTLAAPSISGCGTPTATGDWTGHFTAGATSCSPVFTFAAGKTANNWWECWVNDETTNITFRQTAHSTTTATMTASGSATTSDVIDYACFAH